MIIARWKFPFGGKNHRRYRVFMNYRCRALVYLMFLERVFIWDNLMEPGG